MRSAADARSLCSVRAARERRPARRLDDDSGDEHRAAQPRRADSRPAVAGRPAAARRRPPRSRPSRRRLEHVARQAGPAVEGERDLDHHPDDDPAGQRQRDPVAAQDRAPRPLAARPPQAARHSGRGSARSCRRSGRWVSRRPESSALAAATNGLREVIAGIPNHSAASTTTPRPASSAAAGRRRHSPDRVQAEKRPHLGTPERRRARRATNAQPRAANRSQSIAPRHSATIIGSDCELRM